MGEGTPNGNGYDTELKDVAKGGGLGMVGKFGQQLIAVVIGPVTARLLGAGSYGVLDLCSRVDVVGRGPHRHNTSCERGLASAGIPWRGGYRHSRDEVSTQESCSVAEARYLFR